MPWPNNLKKSLKYLEYLVEFLLKSTDNPLSQMLCIICTWFGARALAFHLQDLRPESRQPKISLVAGLSVNFNASCPRFCNQAKFPDNCTTSAGCSKSLLRTDDVVVAAGWLELVVAGGCTLVGWLLDKPAAAKPQMSCTKSLSQSGGNPNGRNSCAKLICDALERWRVEQKTAAKIIKYSYTGLGYTL